MIKSMTAYGRASQDTPFGKLVVEIHSVNRKMLDMSIYLPKDLIRFEVQIRKWAAAQLERGQVSIRISLQNEEMGVRLLQAQATQLKGLKAAWEKIAQEVGCDPKSIDLRFLVDQMQSFSPIEKKEDEAQMGEVLKDTLETALCELMAMKKKEGQALQQDIEKRLGSIDDSVKRIESRKEDPVGRYRNKIIERLQEISSLTPEVNDRIGREIALMAEKLDVTEEIVRLHSHLQQFRAQLALNDKSIGRALDFLVQEMNREINTLGAKSADIEGTSLVVAIKGELEKIREQVQNIE